jgi:hypothetical protein
VSFLERSSLSRRVPYRRFYCIQYDSEHTHTLQFQSIPDVLVEHGNWITLLAAQHSAVSDQLRQAPGLIWSQPPLGRILGLKINFPLHKELYIQSQDKREGVEERDREIVRF